MPPLPLVVGILGGGLLGGDRDGAALVDLRAGRGILRFDDRIIGRVAGDLQREVAAQRGLGLGDRVAEEIGHADLRLAGGHVDRDLRALQHQFSGTGADSRHRALLHLVRGLLLDDRQELHGRELVQHRVLGLADQTVWHLGHARGDVQRDRRALGLRRAGGRSVLTTLSFSMVALSAVFVTDDTLKPVSPARRAHPPGCSRSGRARSPTWGLRRTRPSRPSL